MANISSCWVNAISRRGIVLSCVGISSFGSVFFLFPIREARAHAHSTQVKSPALPPPWFIVMSSPVSSSELTPYANLCLTINYLLHKTFSAFGWFILICQLIIQLAHDVENETMLCNIGLCNNIYTDLSIMTILLIFITIIVKRA